MMSCLVILYSTQKTSRWIVLSGRFLTKHPAVNHGVQDCTASPPRIPKTFILTKLVVFSEGGRDGQFCPWVTFGSACRHVLGCHNSGGEAEVKDAAKHLAMHRAAQFSNQNVPRANVEKLDQALNLTEKETEA